MLLRHTGCTVATDHRRLARAATGARFAAPAGVRAAAVILTILALAPACGVDCFDDGELEAAYRNGEQDAVQSNALAYERGKTDGRGFDQIKDPTAYDQGLAEGQRLNPDYRAGYDATFAPAYDRGKQDGIVAGYSDGWNDGYVSGYEAGYATVYDGCYSGSYSSAYEDGYEDGWDDGWTPGYDAGYADGYSDGASC